MDQDLTLTSVMNPIVRAMRANVARRDNWAQIRIGACALLLPPLTLGAAFYSMLAAPDEGAARPPGTAAKTQFIRAESPRDTAPAPSALASASNARQPSPGPAAADMARADSRPPQVTGAPVTSWPAPAEASMALLPRALAPPGKASSQAPPPPRLTTQTPAARAPSAAAPPSAEGSAPAPPAARKHARGEAAAARPSAPRGEPAFSLKDWLEQLGIVARDPGG